MTGVLIQKSQGCNQPNVLTDQPLHARAYNQFNILLCILAVSKSISTIFISNLTRQQHHSSVASELYFQIECKSLNFPTVGPNTVKKIPVEH